MDKKPKSLIIAPVHLEKYLKQELVNIKYKNTKNIFMIYDDINCSNILWQNTSWQNPKSLSFSSVKEGAEKLKAISKKTYYIPHNNHRRAILMQDYLRKQSPNRIDFHKAKLVEDFCEWTLLDKNTLLYETKPSHPYPLGRAEFIENKIEPPSRAYLKLWEVFTFYLPLVKSNETCIDLGSSPGGWTWFLADYFSHVTSVDSADLKLKKHPNIEYLKKDAFKIKDFSKYHYLFSDMACEPEKLYELVSKLMQTSDIHTYVCTIKLSDKKSDLEVIKKFQSIKNAKVIHLYQNKHELTWIYSSKFSIA